MRWTVLTVTRAPDGVISWPNQPEKPTTVIISTRLMLLHIVRFCYNFHLICTLIHLSHLFLHR